VVYRALDFLVAHHLVHRIESRNAFIACVHEHAGRELALFLICETCGTVGESSPGTVAQSLAVAAREDGFMPRTSVVEITGVCAHCRRGS
jgi:Fur family zinc uptake transcriptional regulator